MRLTEADVSEATAMVTHPIAAVAGHVVSHLMAVSAAVVTYRIAADAVAETCAILMTIQQGLHLVWFTLRHIPRGLIVVWLFQAPVRFTVVTVVEVSTLTETRYSLRHSPYSPELVQIMRSFSIQ